MDKRKQSTFVCSERTLCVLGWETRLQKKGRWGVGRRTGKKGKEEEKKSEDGVTSQRPSQRQTGSAGEGRRQAGKRK